jgi:hypothetical protein
MNIDTKTIEKFLSDLEIDKIKQIMELHNIHTGRSGEEHNDHQANYHYIQLYDYDPHKEIANILLPKIREALSEHIYIDDCHIMDSFKPYTPHSDTLTPAPKEGYNHAWTLIIPLDDYFSNTFMFEEKCPWTKNVTEWVTKEKILPKYAISDHMYQQYFTHSEKNEFNYLTIHDIFPWRKGWFSATNRARFHCSDNYLARGIKMKQAIVMWTSLPDNFLSN